MRILTGGSQRCPRRIRGTRGDAALTQSADFSQEIKGYDLGSVMAQNINESTSGINAMFRNPAV